jgi:hypothetical protein
MTAECSLRPNSCIACEMPSTFMCTSQAALLTKVRCLCTSCVSTPKALMLGCICAGDPPPRRLRPAVPTAQMCSHPLAGSSGVGIGRRLAGPFATNPTVAKSYLVNGSDELFPEIFTGGNFPYDVRASFFYLLIFLP